jgi:hypothetical protein
MGLTPGEETMKRNSRINEKRKRNKRQKPNKPREDVFI